MTRPDDRLAALPDQVRAYVLHLVERLQAHLGADLLGAYLVGSAALGGFVPGRSDIDAQAVCAEPLTRARKERLVGALAHPTLACPTRGCEFVLYSRAAVADPASGGAYEINLNSGPRMAFHVSYEPAADPAFWFVLDRAILREHGLRLVGPEPRELVAPMPRPRLCQALLAALRWHAEHDRPGADSILNACRAWRFAEEGRWSSKVEAAAWARTRTGEAALIERALALRAGTTDQALEPGHVHRFLEQITARLERPPAGHRP
jgi:Domain of unknown function (DUF4111)